MGNLGGWAWRWNWRCPESPDQPKVKIPDVAFNRAVSNDKDGTDEARPDVVEGIGELGVRGTGASPVWHGRNPVCSSRLVEAAGGRTAGCRAGGGRRLSGQVVDGEVNALAGRRVIVRQGRHHVAGVITDANGRFTIRGLHGGTFLLATAGATMMVRAWSAGTAPPSAAGQVTLVVTKTIVRGQDAEVTGTWGEFLTNFWVLSGIATAIALPIALADDDKPLASP